MQRLSPCESFLTWISSNPHGYRDKDLHPGRIQTNKLKKRNNNECEAVHTVDKSASVTNANEGTYGNGHVIIWRGLRKDNVTSSGSPQQKSSVASSMSGAYVCTLLGLLSNLSGLVIHVVCCSLSQKCAPTTAEHNRRQLWALKAESWVHLL